MQKTYERHETNEPPIALAGPDQVITLPTDSILLDANVSSDPDGMISSYEWIKIAGPGTFYIVNTSRVVIIVNELAKGVYSFELTVTDKAGLSWKEM